MGRLIPAGSGADEYTEREIYVEGEEEEESQQSPEFRIKQSSVESLAGLL